MSEKIVGMKMNDYLEKYGRQHADKFIAYVSTTKRIIYIGDSKEDALAEMDKRKAVCYLHNPMRRVQTPRWEDVNPVAIFPEAYKL